MNMRKPPFDDLRVRKAMAHLLDREKINSTLMYSQYFMHKSYWEDLYDAEHECKNPLYPYDKEKARVLLQSAGWKPNANTGILEKDGATFKFKFLTRAASADKYLAVYTEDLKDVGIDMSIDRKDWATWIKSMDEFNFQMTWAAWGASLFKDPEGMWSSKEAMRRSGNNHAGFTNALVDAYIEQQRAIFDVQKRHDICRKVDAILTSECPYALLWNIDYVRLLYWNKFGTPPTVLSKYGDEGAAYLYWWIDEDSAADLEDAIAKGKHLPATSPEVAFDAEFRP
jgi:microcin C transport system substrate-binding protein